MKAIILVLIGLVLVSDIALGEDWTTSDGKVYKDAKITSHDAKVVTISYSDGSATFPITNLPQDVQKRIASDNTTAADWTTNDGKFYKGVKVLKQDDSSVTILCDDGGAIIPLGNLPVDLQKKFNYDPEKVKAENQRKAEMEAAAAQAQADQAAKEREAYIASITKTLKEVDTDKTSFIGKKFMFEGTIQLDSYYNWGYQESQGTHYSFKADQGDVSCHLYILKSEPKADQLRKALLAAPDGTLKLRFLVEIDPQRFEADSSETMLLLLDYYQPTAEQPAADASQ